MGSTVDTWVTIDSTPAAAFSDEKLARARKRLESGAVSPNGTGRSWVVAGDARLGDSYPSYRVHRPAGTVNYHCDCYDHASGESRARRICSHVKAVILWRSTPEGKRWLWRQEQIDKARKRAEERRGLAGGSGDDAHRPPLVDPDEGAASERPGAKGPRTGSPADQSPASPSGATLTLLDYSSGSGGRADPPPLPSDPADPSWGTLPSWLTEWRPHQLEAISEILDLYRAGRRVVFMEAPTGSGKSGIGVGVARQLGGSAAYLCSTKTLQDQLDRDDWPGARVLKGRSNYEPQESEDAWGDVTCADCTREPGGEECRWCPDVLGCPYTLAKESAMGSRLAVLNYAYALTDWNLARGSFAGRSLAILDEGDVLESELMGFVEVALGKRLLGELKLGQPARKTIAKGEVAQPEWERWVREDAIPAVSRAVEKIGPDKHLSVREIRHKKRLRELVRKLKQLAQELPLGGWVYTGYDEGHVVFKPVKVDRYGQQNLWRHAQRHLVMSATLISADEMADSLGLGDGDWGLVTVPSTFPAENRPIRVAKVADMGFKNRDVAWPKMCEAVSGVATLHPDERILVHAHTYALAGKIKGHLLRAHPRRKIVSYTQANQRQGALERYLATEGAILVAPSMDRGVDLPDEACRVQVVCKVPFPFLGDHQIKARMYSPGGRSWYTVQAIRTLVQATGRGVRHEDDRCVSYILDSAFVDSLWGANRRLFPKWWTEALDWRFDVRQLGVD